MTKTFVAALAAVSLLSLAACQKQPAAGTTDKASGAPAGEGINGTWKADLATVQIDTKPDQFLLKDGKFSCASCTPPLTIAADGAFHPVAGRAYADSMGVKIDDDHNVTQSSKKGSQDLGDTKYSVSADGKTLTVNFTDSSVPNAKPVTGKFTETRVADAPAGAHALSGSWKIDKYNSVSDEGLTVTYKLDGDTLHMTSPAGTSYDAKLDGTPAPIKGDIAGTTASVKKTGDNVYEETDTRDGKVVGVTDMTVDGGKLHVVGQDKRNGSTTKYDANRS
ncbi:MAG: hypothetical protein ACXWI1_03575 [Croceibacterium sp.]